MFSMAWASFPEVWIKSQPSSYIQHRLKYLINLTFESDETLSFAATSISSCGSRTWSSGLGTTEGPSNPMDDIKTANSVFWKVRSAIKSKLKAISLRKIWPPPQFRPHCFLKVWLSPRCTSKTLRGLLTVPVDRKYQHLKWMPFLFLWFFFTYTVIHSQWDVHLQRPGQSLRIRRLWRERHPWALVRCQIRGLSRGK